MASRRNVVSFYTAPARSGKTYRMVVRICNEILPGTEGVIYTNLPLHVDRIAEYCSGKYGMDEDEVRERIHLISREVEAQWRDAGRPIYDLKTGRKTGSNPFDGPWDYFEDKPLSGATVIIDEIHNFCGSIGTPKAVSNNWQKWLGELGHNQAIFICISQAPEKVHQCIKQEAQASYTIRNTGLDRDPYFGIEFYDWFELWTGLFGGEYKVFVFEQETQKLEEKKVKGQRILTLMGQPYFSFYDSFNQPIAGGQTENVKAFEHEYEKHLRKGFIRGRLSLLRWFVVKNIQPLVSRGGMAIGLAGILLFMMNGGAGEVARYISDSMSDSFRVKTAVASDKPESVAAKLPEVKQNRLEDDMLKKIRETYEEELRKALIEKEQATLGLEAVQKELEAAQAELARRSALILITPETVVFKGGHVYEVGQDITTGDYKGKRLFRIDYRRREAMLDDGSVLGLAD